MIPKRKFKAKLNPFKNYDTGESLKKLLNLDTFDPKRKYLTDFIAEKLYEGVKLPENPFDIEPAMKERIKMIVEDENRKMRQHESWDMKFDRLKREV